MTKTFADTFYYLALLHPGDGAHGQAMEVTSRRSGILVTTHWVLTEVGDALASPKTRHRFAELVLALEADPHTIVIPADAGAFAAGMKLYEARPDKSWPLTDCISFCVMKDQNIIDALTGDHHFAQAGFNTLLRGSQG